jgi:hypothetical protein
MSLLRKAAVMPGPQSATPKPVTPSRPRRRFQLSQANRSLPLVSRIVADIVRTHASAVELQEKLQEGLSAKQQQLVQEQLDRESDKLQGYVDELQEIGCELKDYSIGLVDFIGRHQGRDVCLCWKLGEKKVAHWHELSAGFAGRQPVSSLEEDDE